MNDNQAEVEKSNFSGFRGHDQPLCDVIIEVDSLEYFIRPTNHNGARHNCGRLSDGPIQILLNRNRAVGGVLQTLLSQQGGKKTIGEVECIHASSMSRVLHSHAQFDPIDVTGPLKKQNYC